MLTIKDILESNDWPGDIVSDLWETDRKGWVKHIGRILGEDFDVETLDLAAIRRLQKGLYRERDDDGKPVLGPNSINKVTHAVLRAIARDWLEWPDSRRHDLWRQVKILKGETNSNFAAWPLAERDALLNLAASHWKDKPEFLGFIEFLFGTGCRPSEACGLRWGDITWPTEHCSGSIHIQRGRVRGQVSGGKTKQANRNIPLTDLAARALGRLDRRGEGDFVFISPRKGARPGEPCPLDTHNFSNRHWKELLDKAQAAKIIESRRVLYACRHTFVSCIGAHLPIAEVAKLIGDEIETTEKKYFRYLKPHNLDQINSLLGGGNARHLATVAPATAEAGLG
jgi:integrase